MSPVVYRGVRDHRDALRVTKQIDDTPALKLPPRFDLRRHSPDGFECGYNGSGPAQLALAIVTDVLGDDHGQEVYQRFKRELVANWPRTGFTITAEAVDEWAKALEES